MSAALLDSNRYVLAKAGRSFVVWDRTGADRRTVVVRHGGRTGITEKQALRAAVALRERLNTVPASPPTAEEDAI